MVLGLQNRWSAGVPKKGTRTADLITLGVFGETVPGDASESVRSRRRRRRRRIRIRMRRRRRSSRRRGRTQGRDCSSET